jgi:D-alanine-D-alanine ligase
MDLSAKVFRILGVRDVGRIDYRLTDEGELYFLEVNALPSLEEGASLYLCGALAGLDTVSKVLQSIIRSAAARQNVSVSRMRKRRRTSQFLVGLTYNRPGQTEQPGTAVEAVREGIESYGHEVAVLEATPDLPAILPASGVEFVFNMARGVRGRRREAQVPALLELLGLEFTGSDSMGMAFAFDKPLCKRLVSEAGCEVPAAQLISNADEKLRSDLTFPVIVKPVAYVADLESDPVVVGSETELRTVAAQVLSERREPLVVESYIRGREFILCLLGEVRPRVLPPMEAIFEPQREWPYLTNGLDRQGVTYRVTEKLEPGLTKALSHAATAAFTALGCRDLARVVLRVDDKGRLHFLACTPLPNLTPLVSDTARIAKAAGINYRSLIGEIMAPAIRRLKESHSERILAHRA